MSTRNRSGKQYDRFDVFTRFVVMNLDLPYPADMEPGVIYISHDPIGSFGGGFIGAKHLCPCGCGFDVYVPTNAVDGNMGWALFVNGSKGITLGDEDGNCTSGTSLFNRPCGAHYFVENSRVRWA